jgi:glycosyltransferase involved in cell wall biosynthesis
LLCEAFTRLVQRGENVSLTLVGEGPLRQSLGTSLPAEATQRVDFAGFRPVADLPKLFADHNVFVLPSRHDGWGVVVNQAIAAGMPVIATDAVGAGQDLVVPERNGYRITTGSADALFDAMLECVQSPERVARFGAASSSAADSISLQQAVEDWHRFFVACLSGSDDAGQDTDAVHSDSGNA